VKISYNAVRNAIVLDLLLTDFDHVWWTPKYGFAIFPMIPSRLEKIYVTRAIVFLIKIIGCYECIKKRIKEIVFKSNFMVGRAHM
jgi:hypothetical protein